MTALVLSGGGMFGAWQAGVWAGIEGSFRPDMVIGASVGSLNGWLIASGCPAGELLRRWREADEFRKIRWRVPRSVLGGVVNTAELERQLRSLCELHTPQLPMGVVAIRLPRLRPTLFQNGLTWQHLAASCAVPLLLPAYPVDGGRYWDGGLLGPVPLWAAGKMGATRAVVVNALHPVPRPVRAAARVLRLYARMNPAEAKGVEVIEIGPPARLGAPEDIAVWKRDNAERWIESGLQVGRDWADRLGSPSMPQRR